MYVDIHAHLELLEGLDEVIKTCAEKKVSVIGAGIDPKTNRLALEFACKYDNVSCSLGIYPFDKKPDFDIDLEIDFIRSNSKNIVAIGEVGLDDSYPEEFHLLQEEVFVKMIKLAKELDIPLVVHSRKAEAKVLDVLEREGAKKVILHCFCGRSNLVERGSALGYHFSIPSNLARAENFQRIVSKVSINLLLTETDSPYLGPVKGEGSNPLFVIDTVKEIAKIKGFDVDETRMNLFLNYKRLFS